MAIRPRLAITSWYRRPHNSIYSICFEINPNLTSEEVPLILFFSNSYFGQYWSETFRTSGVEAAKEANRRTFSLAAASVPLQNNFRNRVFSRMGNRKMHRSCASLIVEFARASVE